MRTSNTPQSRQAVVDSGDQPFSAFGFCTVCNRIHGLPAGTAANSCRQLMHHLHRWQSIELDRPGNGDPRLSTASLFGEAGGKMFGVLECCDRKGELVLLRAFSGQYNGRWLVPGWAPPLFDLDEFNRLNDQTERQIKALGARIADLPPHSRDWLELRRQRRLLSRSLMRELHAIYRLTNFRGHTAPLTTVFIGKGGAPTGTGDCCAPKLLHQAAAAGLTPVGIAEFYWGRANRLGNRQHGRFYPSCAEKCQPILGHLLCGAGGANRS
ncbi:MAG: hypothetical protein ACK5PS_13235 [Desulfopila sp.]